MLTYLLLLVAVLVGIVIGSVIGGVMVLRTTKKQILLWLMTVERRAREASGANYIAMIELPGYQGIVRQYRKHFDV